MSEEIVVAQTETRFEITVNGELAGVLDFSDSSGLRSMPHTEVDPAYRGRGVASTLIEHALDRTRAEGLQVLPLCPAVAKFIAKNPGYLDLVPDAERDRFSL